MTTLDDPDPIGYGFAMTSEGQTTYRVPAENLGRLRYDLAKLNKRAQRLGLGEIGLTIVKSETFEETDDLGFKTQRTFHTVEVTGTTPVLEGWHFVAALKHIEGEVLVKVVAGETLPDRFLNASPDDCDHCHTRRRRLAAFVVEHTDGRTALVGRNCLADFIRTTSPETLAAQAEFLTSLDFGGYEEDGADHRAGGYHRINAEDLMVLTLREIAANGYVSKAKATKPEHATVHRVTLTIGGSTTFAATEAERAEAAAIIEWARAWGEDADPSTDDYRFNVGVVSRMEYVEQRAWGIFVSIPKAKARAEEKAEARAIEAAKPSEWIGTIAKREVFTLTVARDTRTIEGDYGTTYLYSFVDAAGSEVRYFASRPVEIDRGTEAETLSDENAVMRGAHTRPLRVGDTVALKATVKAHETYNGRKQTLITRGVVQALLGHKEKEAV